MHDSMAVGAKYSQILNFGLIALNQGMNGLGVMNVDDAVGKLTTSNKKWLGLPKLQLN